LPYLTFTLSATLGVDIFHLTINKTCSNLITHSDYSFD